MPPRESGASDIAFATGMQALPSDIKPDNPTVTFFDLLLKYGMRSIRCRKVAETSLRVDVDYSLQYLSIRETEQALIAFKDSTKSGYSCTISLKERVGL
jgi:hypothetical protein